MKSQKTETIRKILNWDYEEDPVAGCKEGRTGDLKGMRAKLVSDLATLSAWSNVFKILRENNIPLIILYPDNHYPRVKIEWRLGTFTSHAAFLTEHKFGILFCETNKKRWMHGIQKAEDLTGNQRNEVWGCQARFQSRYQQEGRLPQGATWVKRESHSFDGVCEALKQFIDMIMTHNGREIIRSTSWNRSRTRQEI